MRESGAVIVSWDFSKGMDNGVAVVGKQSKKGRIDVINAFQGCEARDLVKKLIGTKKEKK